MTSKPQKPANDYSPLSRINNENNYVDLNDSPYRTKNAEPNDKTTKDERPKEVANRIKARTLFNSTNTKFNEEFHVPNSPIRQPLSQTISAPDSPIQSNKIRRPMVKFNSLDSANKRSNQTNPFKTPTKQQSE